MVNHRPDSEVRAHLEARSLVSPITGCRIYHGLHRRQDRRGYADIQYRGRTTGAHRVAWIVNKGPIPAGMHVLHCCDNPVCINLDHLFLGTHAQNMADKVAKGRHLTSVAAMHAATRGNPASHLRGEKHPRAKLEHDQARDILALRGCASGVAVAKEFGVSKSLVYGIWSGDNWAWLTRDSEA